MYEANEHWKQYKQAQTKANELNNKLKLELDKFLNKLVIKNGVTNY